MHVVSNQETKSIPLSAITNGLYGIHLYNEQERYFSKFLK